MKLSRMFQTEDRELDMTPMIDVTFLLLIFFMCTIKFKTLEGKLEAYLPKDVGVALRKADRPESVEITLRVLNAGAKLDLEGKPWSPDAGNRFRFGADRVLEYRVGPRKTTRLAELAERLAELRQEDDQRSATIDARPGVVYADVVEVLDRVMAARFEDVTFVGSYE